MNQGVLGEIYVPKKIKRYVMAIRVLSIIKRRAWALSDWGNNWVIEHSL